MSFRIRSPLTASSPTSTPLSRNWPADWNTVVLLSIARKALPPTIASRWLFIWSMLAYDAWQYSSSEGGAVDMFVAGKAKVALDAGAQELWVESCLDWATKYLLVAYLSDSLDNANAITTKHAQTDFYGKDAEFLAWKARASAYMTARDQDGWKAAATLSAPLANAGRSIIVNSSSLAQQQDLTQLPDPTAWTPLAFVTGSGTVVKNYLSPEWGSVQGFISTADKAQATALAETFFPSPDAWAKEVQTVVDAAANLTDRQKMIAEFWAGGPGTITPPGIWNFIAGVMARCHNISLKEEATMWGALGAAVFDAGIVAWTMKRAHMQSRPIQEVRRRYRGQTLTSWDGSAVAASAWLPYQEANFVTPPFPDFQSGHSTFSAAAARVLYYTFDSSSVNMNGKTVDANLGIISTLFSGSSSKVVLSSLFVGAGASKVQSSTPVTGLSLSWSSFDDLAREAGESRIYGGIHVESSNQAGMVSGTLVGDLVWKAFA